MNNLVSYLALAYVSQTLAHAASSLIPTKSPQLTRLIAEWMSTGTGVALAFTAKMDVLGDVGLEIGSDPLGYIITGVILGHGVHYAMRFLANGPKQIGPPTG